jgi:hypothetical protein
MPFGPWPGTTGGGSFPGYGAPGTIEGNSPSAGSEATVLRSDSLPGQNITAEWALPVSNAVPNTRFFALDGTNGNDNNQGWSDISAADAGAVAVKTAARFNQIVPVDGKGRNALLLINAGTYSEWASFASGRYGYNYLVIRATVTNATANSVAFSDSTTDQIMSGGVTATGMNASGYNPIAGATTRSIPCLQVGGGSPGFPAEVPISLPGGCRLRFDSNTSTVALRGFVSTVVKVSGGNTLEIAKLAPAVPGIADVFYLEMPGAIFTHVAAEGQNSDATIMAMVGLQTNGTVSGARGFYLSGGWNAAFCWNSGLGQFEFIRSLQCSLNSVYQYNAGSVDTGGACRSVGSIAVTSCAAFGVAIGTSPYGNGLSFVRTASVELPSSFVSTAGVDLDLTSNVATNESDPDSIGTSPVDAGLGFRAGRIIGPGQFAGLYLGASAFLGEIEFSGMGALPCIKVVKSGGTYFLNGLLSNGTAGGNADVGLDVTLAYGCVFVLTSAPTVTGTVGDVRLGGGQIITWASLFATGMTDSNGNRFISSNSSPLSVVGKFSGLLTQAEGAVFNYLSDSGIGEAIIPGTNQVDPNRYPTSLRLITRLRGCVPLGTPAGGAVTFTLYKNGVATAATCTIAASASAGTKASDLSHPILFLDGDDYDLRVNAGIIPNNIAVSAIVEGPS